MHRAAVPVFFPFLAAEPKKLCTGLGFSVLVLSAHQFAESHVVLCGVLYIYVYVDTMHDAPHASPGKPYR